MSDATREEIGVASSRYRQHLYSEKPIREIYPKAADESEAWARWQADKTVCANAFLQVQTDWICLLNDGARIDDQIEALQADLTAARAEIERLRVETERYAWLAKQDGCALINDDQGHWAVATDGMQSLSMNPPDDCDTSFFVEKRWWKPTIAEAIDYAIVEQLREDDEAQAAARQEG